MQKDKYLRLTGLWQSKGNSDHFTGKLRVEDVDGLKAKVKEAIENDAPLVFSMWVNAQKTRKDPKYSLQCFVGDNEEMPKRKKWAREEPEEEEEEEEEEKPAPKKKKKVVEEEPEDEEEEEEQPAPKKKKPKPSDDW